MAQPRATGEANTHIPITVNTRVHLGHQRCTTSNETPIQHLSRATCVPSAQISAEWQVSASWVVSLEGAQQGSAVRTFLQTLSAPQPLCDLWQMSPLLKCERQMIPGQVHSPFSKPYGQVYFKIENVSDFKKAIGGHCSVVMPVVGLSSNTSI